MNKNSLSREMLRKNDLELIKDFLLAVKEKFKHEEIQKHVDSEIMEIDKLLLKFKSGA